VGTEKKTWWASSNGKRGDNREGKKRKMCQENIVCKKKRTVSEAPLSERGLTKCPEKRSTGNEAGKESFNHLHPT